MYLTRMFLNPARRGTAGLLSSPQRMHAAVLAAFPPGTETENEHGRVLWRVDRGRSTRTELFVSSPSEPDLTHVIEQAGWPTGDTWETRPYSPLLGRITADQEWAFRLTANPVHHIRRREGEPTKPTAHGVGTAVAQLHRATGAESTVTRFKAAGSATTMAETLHHLRGLITQFRSHDIPLDYARLTWDLYRLQRNETAAAVRRAWGRDLHRVPRPETDINSDAADTAQTTETLGDPE